MSVNWTGSGSYLLGQQRRKQRQRHPRPKRRYEYDEMPQDHDDGWLTNTRGNPGMPSSLASPSPPPEQGRNTVYRVEVHNVEVAKQAERQNSTRSSADGQNRIEMDAERRSASPRAPPATLSRPTQQVQAGWRPQSRRELCVWLLSKPNWVGASEPKTRPANRTTPADPKGVENGDSPKPSSHIGQ